MNRRQFLVLTSGLLVLGPAGKAVPPAVAYNRTTGLVYDDIFLDHWLAPGHPESPERLLRMMVVLEHSGLLDQLQRLERLPDVLGWIYRIHTPEHVRSIQARYGRTHDVACAVVGGVLAAVKAVCSGELRNAFCATRPPGHHAMNTGREEGFCFYNAVAIAARYAQKAFNLERILIVDWDYHHGNGTEAAFYSDPSVLFFSTHDFHAYPGTGDPARTGDGAGKGFNINVHLPCGANDTDIIKSFEEKLLPAAHEFKPDLILISAGFDSRKDDLLGCLEITDGGFITLTKMVMELAARYCKGRIVSVLEGGYNLDGLASAVVDHIRTLLRSDIENA
jgi:acetoin utilization deacetylase AcuC-like enzyme